MSGYQGLCYSTVVGQEKAVRLVERGLQSGRIPHGYIFRGPDGVGKKLFARGLGAALNCREGGGMHACGECGSCRKYLSGSHPDHMLVSPDKGMIKIGQVRELIRAIDFPPYESQYRVVLIEDVHTMRQEAANALLKTLEEPPAGNILILTADASRELLNTISSRCQVIPFYGLEPESAAGIMRTHQPEMDMESALLLARLAEGSPGRGLEFFREELVGLFRELLKVVCDPSVHPERDIHLLLGAAKGMAERKEQLVSLLGLFRLWLRDCLLELSGRVEETSLAGSAFHGVERPKCWSSGELFAKLRAVDRAERELMRNCNRALVCEVLLFGLQEPSGTEA